MILVWDHKICILSTLVILVKQQLPRDTTFSSVFTLMVAKTAYAPPMGIWQILSFAHAHVYSRQKLEAWRVSDRDRAVNGRSSRKEETLGFRDCEASWR